MIKFMMCGVISMMLTVPFTSCAQKTSSDNGTKIYETGSFPQGKQMSITGLVNLPNGKWQEKVYLVDPIEFKGSGQEDANGNYNFTAKINRTLVGGLFVSVTNSAASTALFKITIPYKTPLQNGSVYKFTEEQPLTVISKISQMNSSGKQFAIYSCIFQGRMIIDGKIYPNNK